MEKFSQRALLLCLLAALLAVPAGTALWSWRDTTAYYENRSLAAFPAVTVESLWDGSLGSDLEGWYADHAPGRTTLLKADTAVQMNFLRRPVVNEVVDAGDVLLPLLSYEERAEEDYPALARAAAEPFGKLSAYIEDYGGTFCYVGVPEQRVYFRDKYPDYLPRHETEATAGDTAYALCLAEAGVDFLDMGTVYDAQGHRSEYYSAIDHHYSYYGAYAAYRAILDHLAEVGWDLPVLRPEDLDFQELPNPYIATRNRKLYNLWPSSACRKNRCPSPGTTTESRQKSPFLSCLRRTTCPPPTTCTWAGTSARRCWRPTARTCRTPLFSAIPSPTPWRRCSTPPSTRPGAWTCGTTTRCPSGSILTKPTRMW